MEIEFDPDKDVANLEKHGVSLAIAGRMDFSSALVLPDNRYAYGEDRFRALGLVDGRLYVLIFTMRDDVLRAISLRKANKREVRQHDEKA